jgi:hypothetical protein
LLFQNLQGWEDTVLKQDQEGGGQLETKMSLPATPSLYITAFLFQGCQEIYRIGGHVLDKVILQLFAWRLLEKVHTFFYNFFFLNVLTIHSEILLEIRLLDLLPLRR